MNYKTELGIIGNIKLLFTERNRTNNKVYNEVNDREAADTENREAVEQAMTDYELDMIQAQQDLTDLQIQILEGTK